MIDWLESNILWKFSEWYVVALITCIPGSAALKYGFGLLDTYRRQIVFMLTVPVVLAIGLTAMNQANTASPNLIGDAQLILKGGQLVGVLGTQNVVLVVESITNAGSSPSIARNFRLTLNLRGKTYEGESSTFPKPGNIVLTPKNTDETVILSSVDMLYDKALNPISVGGQVTGILYFNFPALTNGTIDAEPSPNLSLSFQDAKGKIYKQAITFSNDSFKPGIIPGITETVKNNRLPSP